MAIESDQLYHIYNRGNDRQRIFFQPAHYLYFLRKIRRHVRPHGAVLAYCLMPNHFHFLVLAGPGPAEQHPLLPAFGVVLGSYTQGINQERARVGSLFQAKTKARLLTSPDGRYAPTCFHYLHQNPLRAGLAAELAAWPYSSYRDYAGLRTGSLCDQATARALLDLPADPQLFQRESQALIDPERVKGWL